MNAVEFSDFLRKNGFKVFPLGGKKEAGNEWKSEETRLDYNITGNYGYSPLTGAGTAIIDFDTKKFESFAKKIAEKHMVIETGRGYHIPVKGVKGSIQKTELWDIEELDTVSANKTVEIQSPKFYCVGPGSEIYHEKLEKNITYENIGTMDIFDYDGLYFYRVIDELCEKFNLQGKKADSSKNHRLREKAAERLPPGKGESNDYPYQATLQMRMEGLDRDKIKEELRKIYDKWEKSSTYSQRPFDNFIVQMDRAMDAELPAHGGYRHGKRSKEINYQEIFDRYTENRKIYSDKHRHQIYENHQGFLKTITETIKSDLLRDFSDVITNNTYKHYAIDYIEAHAPDLPDLNEDIVVFKNGYFNWKTKIFTPSYAEELALVGFEKYNFITDPQPVQFLDFINSTFKTEQERNQALLAMFHAIIPKHDIKITMCYGGAGTGKTTFRDILTKILGEYAATFRLEGLTEKYATAALENKTYLTIAEAPRSVRDFERLKQITGEEYLDIRPMHGIATKIKNYVKTFIDTNNLFRVIDEEAKPMFDRLHLLEFNIKFRNTEEEKEDLAEQIADAETEDILSYLLLFDRSIEYTTPQEVKRRWDEITLPEQAIFRKLFEYNTTDQGLSLIEIKQIMETHLKDINLNVLKDTIKNEGYTLDHGKYRGLVRKEEKNLDVY